MTDRSATLTALRAEIRALEGPAPPLLSRKALGSHTTAHGAMNDNDGAGTAVPFGLPAVDRVLPWSGVPRAAVHELEGGGDPVLAMGALGGFTAALAARLAGRQPVLWCAVRCDLYPPGLQAFGLDPSHLIVARARRVRDIPRVLEEAVRAGVCGAVVGEIDQLDLTASRRLQLAARTGATPCLLLYRGPRARPGLTAALTRWRITPVSGTGARGLDLLGRPRWQVTLARCRGTAGTHSWRIEWCDATSAFTLAAPLGDRDHTAARRAG